MALVALVFLFVIAAFLVAALSSVAIALLSGTSLPPPGAAELLKGLGAGTLILVLWASFGFALATLFGGAALAVGFGLIYAFTIEPVSSNLSALNGSLRAIAELLPGANTSTLSLALVEASGNPALEENLRDPARSAMVVLIYATVFVLTTALVFRQRDVTAALIARPSAWPLDASLVKGNVSLKDV